MTYEEFQAKMQTARKRAESIAKKRNDRAREACRLAGLDPQLLGIHPHNAMVAFNAGQPWREVDYHYVRLALCLISIEFEGMRIYERLHERLSQQVEWGKRREQEIKKKRKSEGDKRVENAEETAEQREVHVERGEFPGYKTLIAIENNLVPYHSIHIPASQRKDAGHLADAIARADRTIVRRILAKYQSELPKGDVQGGPREVKPGNAVKKTLARIALQWLHDGMEPWQLTRAEWTGLPLFTQIGAFATREQIATDIHRKAHGNPMIPEESTVKISSEAFAGRHVHSDTFILAEIPVRDIDWYGCKGKATKWNDRSRTSGPIVVDANYDGLGRFEGRYGGAPDTVVLDGQHRLNEAREREDDTILAWVGNKIAKRFCLLEAFQAEELEDGFRNNLYVPWAFGEKHRRAVEQAIEEGKPVSTEVLKGYPDLTGDCLDCASAPGR